MTESINSNIANEKPDDIKDNTHDKIMRMPVGDLMKKNYLNYAVSVIMDRALPDVRDGLKPVHRRILFGMYEEKMYPNTAYKKSARMVGYVMGKYHPHGDSSIYEASVNMTQPWSKRVPLIDGQGNFGSIDGDNAAAMRYCFAGGTRVMTEKGLIKIEELVSQEQLQKAQQTPNKHTSYDLNLNVESLKGNKLASKWIYSGVQDTFKITSTNGYEAVCTSNEPFLVLNEKLEYIWVDAEDLKAGDKICMLGKPNQVTSIIGNNDTVILNVNGKTLEKLFTSSTVDVNNFINKFLSNYINEVNNKQAIKCNSLEFAKDIQLLLINYLGIHTNRNNENLTILNAKYIDNKLVIDSKTVLDTELELGFSFNKDLINYKTREADIMERNYHYEEIASIQKDTKQAVYDLTVPDTHAFTANGFIVHNTEMKLTKAGAAFFEDIDKETVNFRENYDGAEMEPEVLPVSYPNIWVNGVEGIAVGMATYLPPHNLNETIDLTLELQVNPDLTTDEVLQIMPAPDFPTGGIVHSLDGFRKAVETGKGMVKVRSKWHAEKGSNGQELLVLDELPYKVNKKTLIEAIADKVHAKDKDLDLADIVDIRDESNKLGIRVVIALKKGAIPAVIFNHLVKKTEVESTYNYNVMLLEGQSPKQMGLVEILSKFLEFRTEVVTKRIQYDLKKAQEKLHLLTGMVTVLSRVNEAVEIIQSNKDGKSANEALRNEFNIDEIQAQSILDMRLQRLTGMEIDSIKADFEETTYRVEDMKDILIQPARIQELVKKDLINAKERFGDIRRTEISYENNEINMEDLVKQEPCLIHLTKNGYLKRMPLSTLETQKRNGKGRIGIQTNDDDYVEAIYSGSTHDYFMVFTESGKALTSRVWKLPDGTTTQRGRHLRNIFDTLNEPVTNILLVPEMQEGLAVITVTEKGKVKRTELTSYMGTMRRKGVQALNIDEGDKLVSVMLAKKHDHLLLVSSAGKAVRFEIDDEALASRGRKSSGVKGIVVGSKAKVIGAMVISSDGKPMNQVSVMKTRIVDGQETMVEVMEDDTTTMDKDKYLFCVGENGVGKRTLVSEFTAHSRGTKGVTCFNINEKTGSLVKAILVTEEEDLMMATANKTIRIAVKDVRVAGRNTAGTMLMNVGEEKLTDAIKVPTEKVEEPLDSLEILTEELHDESASDETSIENSDIIEG